MDGRGRAGTRKEVFWESSQKFLQVLRQRPHPGGDRFGEGKEARKDRRRWGGGGRDPEEGAGSSAQAALNSSILSWLSPALASPKEAESCPSWRAGVHVSSVFRHSLSHHSGATG